MGRGEQPLFSTPGDEAEAGKMSKKVFFGASGESPTADAVMAWLDRVGIDKTMVTGFSTFHHVGEVPRITLEMYFDDTPAPAELEPVSRETSRPGVPSFCPSVEQCAGCPARDTGVEKDCIHRPMSKADFEPSIITVLRADHQTGMHAGQPNLHCPLCFKGIEKEG